MRLYNIYHACKSAMDYLQVVRFYEHSFMTENKELEAQTYLTNLNEAKKALKILSPFDFIKNDVQEAINLISDLQEGKRGAIITSKKEIVISAFDVIRHKIQSIIDLYESIKEIKYQLGIDIYVPPCKYLKEYMAILKDIDFIISQCPYLRNNEEELQYNGTDVGSDWITLVVVTTGVVTATYHILNNFAELTKKVQEIKVRFQKIDQNEEMLKTMKIKNETLKELQEVFAKEKENIYKESIIELKEKLGDLSNGEEEGKVLVSIQKYSDLLDRGVKFYSSIESPPEIKELLPSSDDPKALADTIIKYLENKEQDNNDN